MQKVKFISTFWLLLASTFVLAQQKTNHIALFTSLYLDSAFNSDLSYRYGKNFPKQSISGLEFYLGAQFAIDSLKTYPELNVKVHVYDIRSQSGNIQKITSSPVMDSIDLIIGAVSGNEYLQLAKIAQEKAIPFVSATYPNDGGIKNNPFVLVASPKLNTHLQATYNYILRNLTTFNLIYARRKNTLDNRISDAFNELNKGSNGTPPVRYKTAILSDFPNPQEILSQIDSTKENVIIVGSLDENFGRSLALSTQQITKKSIAVSFVGMPTWEGIKEIQNPEFKNISIVYSNSFYNKKDSWSKGFEEAYRKKTFSRPSDFAYKGYELTWFFSWLLNKYGRDLINHVNEKSYILQTDFDFRPIMWSKDATQPDYYENKRVYLVRRYLGQTSSVN